LSPPLALKTPSIYSTAMDAPFDLLIIGAGWFGLAAAKKLLHSP